MDAAHALAANAPRIAMQAAHQLADAARHANYTQLAQDAWRAASSLPADAVWSGAALLLLVLATFAMCAALMGPVSACFECVCLPCCAARKCAAMFLRGAMFCCCAPCLCCRVLVGGGRAWRDVGEDSRPRGARAARDAALGYPVEWDYDTLDDPAVQAAAAVVLQRTYARGAVARRVLSQTRRARGSTKPRDDAVQA